MRVLLLLFTSFLLLAAACTKADDDTLTTPLDELPPATQVGANTFGCLINGEPWYNRGGSFSRPDLSASYTITSIEPLFSIRAYARTAFLGEGNDRVEIRIKNPISNRFYSSIDSASISLRITNETNFIYITDINSPMQIRLTQFDPRSQIASGTFEFTAINDELMDTLVVTEGRFDVEFIR